MKIYDISKIENGYTYIKVLKNEFDLGKTFDCGQCFRWRVINNQTAYGIVNGKFIEIRKEINNDNKFDLFRINVDSTYDIFDIIDYLGLNDDYSYLKHVNLTDYEKRALKYSYGIRILHQDIFETIISFIISQRNSIPKIKSTIEKLCKAFGETRIIKFNGQDCVYHAFPNPIALIQNYENLKDCGLGYRTEYVYWAAMSYYNNPAYFKERLGRKDIDTEKILNELQKMNGVGPKVANCIALFGYNKLDSFPIDTWISKVIEREYNGHIDISRFGNLAGLMQQYIFYYERYKI